MTESRDVSGATDKETLIALSSDIVAAYVKKNPVTRTNLPNLITNVHAALCGAELSERGGPATAQKPAVPIARSVTNDQITCLECGGKYKSIKRHLTATHGLTPDEYRSKWGLPSDYPMVAPSYSTKRSTVAKQIGLGRKT